jgi:hypothetical protein
MIKFILNDSGFNLIHLIAGLELVCSKTASACFKFGDVAENFLILAAETFTRSQ